MRNTIVVKNITLRMVLANKIVSDLLVTHAEMTKENANSIAKLICDKIDNVMRETETNPQDSLIALLTK